MGLAQTPTPVTSFTTTLIAMEESPIGKNTSLENASTAHLPTKATVTTTEVVGKSNSKAMNVQKVKKKPKTGITLKNVWKMEAAGTSPLAKSSPKPQLMPQLKPLKRQPKDLLLPQLLAAPLLPSLTSRTSVKSLLPERLLKLLSPLPSRPEQVSPPSVLFPTVMPLKPMMELNSMILLLAKSAQSFPQPSKLPSVSLLESPNASMKNFLETQPEPRVLSPSFLWKPLAPI